MNIQECNKGCGTHITVKLDEDGKWKPFEVDHYDESVKGLHNCPNSNYNRCQRNTVAPAPAKGQLKPNDDRKDIPEIKEKISNIELLLTQINQNVDSVMDTV